MNLLKVFAADESGATAIEYSLIAGLISIVIVGALGMIGETLQGGFTAVNDGFKQ